MSEQPVSKTLVQRLRDTYEHCWIECARMQRQDAETLHEVLCLLECTTVETSAVRVALQAFMDFQISDYFRQADAAKHYCELRRQGRAALAGSPGEMTACPKCDAVRKLGLTSCFEHKQPVETSERRDVIADDDGDDL